MLKSFIGADMRLYERFGIGLHNIPDFKIAVSLINTGFTGRFAVKHISTSHKRTYSVSPDRWYAFFSFFVLLRTPQQIIDTLLCMGYLFVNNIGKFREKQGHTQQQLADLVGVDRSQICRYRSWI